MLAQRLRCLGKFSSSFGNISQEWRMRTIEHKPLSLHDIRCFCQAKEQSPASFETQKSVSETTTSKVNSKNAKEVESMEKIKNEKNWVEDDSLEDLNTIPLQPGVETPGVSFVAGGAFISAFVAVAVTGLGLVGTVMAGRYITDVARSMREQDEAEGRSGSVFDRVRKPTAKEDKSDASEKPAGTGEEAQAPIKTLVSAGAATSVEPVEGGEVAEKKLDEEAAAKEEPAPPTPNEGDSARGDATSAPAAEIDDPLQQLVVATAPTPASPKKRWWRRLLGWRPLGRGRRGKGEAADEPTASELPVVMATNQGDQSQKDEVAANSFEPTPTPAPAQAV